MKNMKYSKDWANTCWEDCPTPGGNSDCKIEGLVVYPKGTGKNWYSRLAWDAWHWRRSFIP